MYFKIQEGNIDTMSNPQILSRFMSYQRGNIEVLLVHIRLCIHFVTAVLLFLSA